MKKKQLTSPSRSNFSSIILLCLVIFFLPPAKAQLNDPVQDREEKWVDSVMSTLSTRQKIAQLIIIRANNPGEPYFSVIEKYIRDYDIGGVCFFGGNPTSQAVQTNRWQSLAKTPLLISIDAEWGLGMRLDSTISFPYQMALGALEDDSLIYAMGLEVARQCRRMGIHMNFAPVADINSNPANPVIHMRSFGEDRERVAAKGIAYMKGLQDGGVIATAKHFPGHGDTGSDSHHTLPVIQHDQERLDSVELYPFTAMIRAGLGGVMIAHLDIPSFDATPNTPSTLSGKVVKELLRSKIGFQGLIVTDALDMKGVTLNDKPGEIELKAFKAGNDILLLSADVPAAVETLHRAVAGGVISMDELDERCRRVLRFKYFAGLHDNDTVKIDSLLGDLNIPEAVNLNRRLFEKSLTLVRNDDGLIPLRRLDTLSIASVSIGHGQVTPFQERLSYYAAVTHFSLPKEPAPGQVLALEEKLRGFDLIIIAVQNCGIKAGGRYGIAQETINFIGRLQQQRQKRIILDLFASPYALGLFVPKSMMAVQAPTAILVSYQDHPLMQDLSAQAIFGGVPVSGKLPVTAAPGYPAGSGTRTDAIRLKYTIPEELGIPSASLERVDSIVEKAIAEKVFPGCQVMAIKDGKVFFLRSYGFHTYDNIQPVTDFDLYDLASVTKIVATTFAIMRLTERGEVNPDQVLTHYLPYLAGSNKGSIVIRELMAHQSRLKPWIPFYSNTIADGSLDSTIYRNKPDAGFPTRVAENIYIRKGYDRVIMDTIINSKLLKTSSYKYSDLGYYFLRDVVETVSGKALDVYATEEFYRPLGLSTTGFLPRQRFPLNMIVPTELDMEFRMQLVHGDVHDPGAAMLGGVGGHAGVFSNANDLGVLLQMLLQGGRYGGEDFFRDETILEFTRIQFPLNDNRRGMGFDRPESIGSKNGPACAGASQRSFGHTGFTGTYIWADPESGLAYVFLSNRVYPDAKNTKLSEQRIRPAIHQVLYDAIEKNKKFAR
jgi:beta-glucosidase-like glycosyl hydrolase/CubicO group peptidase (beta-lactamase class C family)